MSPEELAEIDARAARGGLWVADEDRRLLLAEVHRLRAELTAKEWQIASWKAMMGDDPYDEIRRLRVALEEITEAETGSAQALARKALGER